VARRTAPTVHLSRHAGHHRPRARCDQANAHFIFKHRYLIVKRRENLSEPSQQVRTNNHVVERTNRKLLYFEKVRYKWRRRRSIVLFLLFSLQRWWRNHPSSTKPKPYKHCLQTVGMSEECPKFP